MRTWLMRVAWVVVVVWTVALILLAAIGLLYPVFVECPGLSGSDCHLHVAFSLVGEVFLFFVWLIGVLVFALVRYLSDPRPKDRVEVRDIQCRAVNAVGVRCVWPIHGIEREHSDGSPATRV